MSNETLAIVLTAIPPIMLALAVLIPTFLTIANFVLGLRNGKANKRLEIQGDKIHYLVNSNMTKVQTDLAAANMRIEELQELVSKIADRRQPTGPVRAPLQ